MSKITKEKAIEIFNLVANDAYACEISDANGNNCETSSGDGSGMMQAIEGGEYNEYHSADADKDDAVSAYDEMVSRGEIVGESFDEYDYYMITVSNDSVIEVAYIPVGGW